jgi:hypothetical protein
MRSVLLHEPQAAKASMLLRPFFSSMIHPEAGGGMAKNGV